MTRKDFELIAEVVRTAHPTSLGESKRAYLACLFVDRLSEQNPRFDVDRFLRACNAGQPSSAPEAK